jgi:hypothetical protein
MKKIVDQRHVKTGPAWRRLWGDESGVTAVLVALTLAVLVAFAGLGAEVGLWYTIKRQQQSAADVAALSGANEVLAANNSGIPGVTTLASAYPDICGLAKRDAARGGFTFASYSCPTTTPGCTTPAAGQMCANNPPVLGSSAGNTNAFEVILSQNQNTILAHVFLPKVTIDSRAVALVSVLGPACLLSLDPTAADAIFIKGNPTLNMPNCIIVSDSSSNDAIHFQGNAHVTAETVDSHGGITQTGGAATITLTLPAQTHQPVVADPYAPPACPGNGNTCLTHSFLTTGMPTSATPCTVTQNKTTNVTSIATGNCTVNASQIGAPKNGGTVNLPGNIQIVAGSSGWDIKNETVNLGTGTYWITDGNLTLDSNGILDCPNCVPGAAGITIILTTAKPSGGTIGTVNGQANATVGNPPSAPNFNAPGSGAFEDLMIIQDSNGLPAGTTIPNTTAQFQGGPSTVLDGLAYFPKSNLTFNGNPSVGSSGCLLAVVNTLILSGDTQMNSTGCKGPAAPPTVKTVALSE